LFGYRLRRQGTYSFVRAGDGEETLRVAEKSVWDSGQLGEIVCFEACPGGW
jgi:hypothetical protein